MHGPSFDFGAEVCYVKQCNSVRPAFVLEAAGEDVVFAMMCVYIPMGLERQHDIQSSVLARFGSHELASCFLAVASEELGIGYVKDACTCVILEEAQKHGGRHEIVRQWDSLIESRNLHSCFAVEQFTDSTTPDWDHVRKIVEQAAAMECGEALQHVDQMMRTFVI